MEIAANDAFDIYRELWVALWIWKGGKETDMHRERLIDTTRAASQAFTFGTLTMGSLVLFS